MTKTAIHEASPLTGINSDDQDQAFQQMLLQGVSRTFALTIPQLPAALVKPVANAYLLCRIIDTIEDEPALTRLERRRFSEQFVESLDSPSGALFFAESLAPRLSRHTLPAEQQLVRETPRVLGITATFNDRQKGALRGCVSGMARGMVEFHSRHGLRGLEDQPEMDRYCYFVAGIVGEMLTHLFCDYSRDIAVREKQLMALSVSFGQGLQMTNILKDIWADYARGYCWLPRRLFADNGFDLTLLDPDRSDPSFDAGLRQLIGIAHGHLRNALTYTLLLPRQEVGIRRFCLQALAMAMLTLRKLNHYPGNPEQVKIRRSSVRLTVAVTTLTSSRNGVLKQLFRGLALGLPWSTLSNHFCGESS